MQNTEKCYQLYCIEYEYLKTSVTRWPFTHFNDILTLRYIKMQSHNIHVYSYKKQDNMTEKCSYSVLPDVQIQSQSVNSSQNMTVKV